MLTMCNAFKEYFMVFINGMVNYPNFTKALLNEPLFNNNYENFIVDSVTDFLKGIEDKLKPFIPSHKLIDTKLIIIQFMSCFITLGLMPDLFNKYLDGNFKNPEIQNKYLEQLFKIFLL